jgi:lipoprotein-releasing system permease protein
VAAVPERIGTAMIVSSRGASGASIRFVPPGLFSLDKGFASYVVLHEGDAGLDRPDTVLVSSAMAASLGVKAGDRVNILTTWEENLAGPPRLTPVTVAGVYDTGYQELDATLAYAPLALADRILSPRAARTMIGVKVRDPFGDLSAVSRQVAVAAGGDTRVATWRDIEYARLSSFRTTKAMLLFIMALIVVVACVNVSSTILMILFERRHDLGILKSVGAGPGALSVSFLLAGFATGLAGTVIGIATGLLVAVNINEVIVGIEWTINGVLGLASLVQSSFSPSAHPFGAFTLFNSAYYLKSIPVRINPGEVITAAAAALVLSALAAYLPAARASRTRPLEILRRV